MGFALLTMTYSLSIIHLNVQNSYQNGISKLLSGLNMTCFLQQQSEFQTGTEIPVPFLSRRPESKNGINNLVHVYFQKNVMFYLTFVFCVLFLLFSTDELENIEKLLPMIFISCNLYDWFNCSFY